MHPRLLAALAFAAALVAFAQQHGLAQQGQLQLPGFKPPPAAPIKPYQTVAVTPPSALNDPSFTAFRNQLGEVAAHKDRAALAKMVATQNFFWMQDKNLADPRKSDIDNLAKAVELDAPDGSGWQILAGFASEPSAAESPQQPGVYCAPADPKLDPSALEALAKATQTDPSEWGYPNQNGVEVHAAAQPSSQVIEKLGAGARVARHQPACQSQSAVFPARSNAVGQNRIRRCPIGIAARRRSNLLQQARRRLEDRRLSRRRGAAVKISSAHSREAGNPAIMRRVPTRA